MVLILYIKCKKCSSENWSNVVKDQDVCNESTNVRCDKIPGALLNQSTKCFSQKNACFVR